MPGMTTRYGGAGRTSTKTKLARELVALGELLVEFRERAGLKQGEVAARLGVPPSWLSKVENGTRRLDVVELLQIADALGADPGEIMKALQGRLAG